jgi:hypothetical protein
MAAKVGTAPVQFYLGANPVSAYLGATAVARTMYFNGAVDGDWSELGNWWLDAGHTVAAPSLPAAGDSVIAFASITSNSGSEPTVVDLTMQNEDLEIPITVTGMATFNGSAINQSTVTGNATFNDGSATFGFVTGTVTCNTVGACTPS